MYSQEEDIGEDHMGKRRTDNIESRRTEYRGRIQRGRRRRKHAQ